MPGGTKAGVQASSIAWNEQILKEIAANFNGDRRTNGFYHPWNHASTASYRTYGCGPAEEISSHRSTPQTKLLDPPWRQRECDTRRVIGLTVINGDEDCHLLSQVPVAVAKSSRVFFWTPPGIDPPVRVAAARKQRWSGAHPRDRNELKAPLQQSCASASSSLRPSSAPAQGRMHASRDTSRILSDALTDCDVTSKMSPASASKARSDAKAVVTAVSECSRSVSVGRPSSAPSGRCGGKSPADSPTVTTSYVGNALPLKHIGADQRCHRNSHRRARRPQSAPSLPRQN